MKAGLSEMILVECMREELDMNMNNVRQGTASEIL